MIYVVVVVIAFYAGLAVGYALHVWLLQNSEERGGHSLAASRVFRTSRVVGRPSP